MNTRDMNQIKSEIKIFCCYAREDYALLQKLKIYLTVLKRGGLVNIWDDRDISAGTEWKEEIMKNLNEAQIILLLISPDFIHSDYCFGTELERAVERHEQKEAKVIPIVLRNANWKDIRVRNIKLGDLQALPKDAKPITTSQNHDEIWREVAEGIERVVKRLLTRPAQPSAESDTNQPSQSRDSSRLSRNLKGYRQQHPILSSFIIAICVLLVLASTLILRRVLFPDPIPCKSNNVLSPHPQPANSTSELDPFINAPGIKETMTDACGNVIGLSAGATILDTTSADNDEMQKGAAAVRNGVLSDVQSHFQTVINIDASNAEAQIYMENLRVLNQKLNYIAVVLGLDITTGRTGSSRDSMQGAYLAQEAYNRSAPQRNAPSLVVILANSGANPANTTWVAKQILALKKGNPHIVGVVGWSMSSASVNANTILAHQPKEQENVFMLAPSSSSRHLIGSPDFLRIVPSDTTQAEKMANYAYDTLNYRKIAILYTSQDDYVSSLYAAFKDAFGKKNGTSIVSEQPYSQRDLSSLATALSTALQSHPDGIYFAGFAADAGPLLSLPQIANLPPRFKILGGDAVASLSNYPDNQQNLDRLIFTSFAFQDEWQFLRDEQVPQISTFIDNYNSTFKVNTIGPNSLLVYDAVNVLLQGYQKALANGGTDTCLPCALQKTLQNMNGKEAWQGISGQIAFTSGSTEPVDKVVLIGEVENRDNTIRTTKTIDYRGCFLVADKTHCRN
jgi:ABC-type branched-subunit amino acid transport system substrate-binding protein